MHISAIRSYIVELQGDEFQGEAGVADLFPGEHVHKVDRISEMPIILRVETLLPIQGHLARIEPVESDKVEGSMSFTGENPVKEGIASSSSSPSEG